MNPQTVENIPSAQFINAATMAQTFASGDVAQHNKPDSLWIIVDEDVYDVTKFQEEHPGGKKSMTSNTHWLSMDKP